MLALLHVAALLCLAFPQDAVGQGTMGFGNKRSELTPVMEEDIEFVQCQFCQMAAKHLHRSVVMFKAGLPSTMKKLPPDAYDAILDLTCNNNQETGEWLTMMDIQQEGDALVIKKMPQVGACKLECGTLTRICENIFVKHKDEVKELLLNRTPKAQLEQKLCNEVTSACVTPPRPFTGSRKDEEFEVATEEQLEMKKNMAKMEMDGLSGTLMSREEAMKQLEDYADRLGESGWRPEDIDRLRNVAPGSIQDEL